MRDETLVVRAGHPPASQGEAFLPGPVFAGPYHAAGEPAAVALYLRAVPQSHLDAATKRRSASSRAGPRWSSPPAWPRRPRSSAPSLRPGDVVVLPAESYYTTRVLARGYFTEMGVETRLVPTVGGLDPAHAAGARLVWLESPTNPGLDVCDIQACSAVAHAAGALVAVDNTTATPLGQRPLALGADFVLASDTKAMTGHGDLILGHVAVRDAPWADRLRTWRTQTGSVPGPFEVWLGHRSLSTLALRLERQCDNALAIAEVPRRAPRGREGPLPGASGRSVARRRGAPDAAIRARGRRSSCPAAARRSGFSRDAASSTRRPASARSTRRRSAAPAGAATRLGKGSFA